MDLTNILSYIKGTGKKEKLNAISDYIEEKYNRYYEFEEPEDIMDLSIEFDQNDYDNFMYLVTRNYTRHTPFYVYKFFLKDSNKVNDLEELLKVLSENENKIDVDDKYEFSKIEFNKKKNGARELAIHYNRYSVFFNGKKYEREGIIRKGITTITFNTNDNLMYINIGEDSLNNIIKKFLIDNLYTCVIIEPLRITEPNIKYNGPIGVDKVTIFMLELLTKRIKENRNFIINDYIKVGIANPKNEKIKSIMVRGNDLLNERDLVLKIQNGFKLKTADFNLSWILNDGNNAVNISVGISIQSTVKISIIETTNRTKNLEILKMLSECIIKLLDEEITLRSDVISHYFGTVKSMIEAQRRISKQKFMDMIMQDENLKKYTKKIEEIYNAI